MRYRITLFLLCFFLHITGMTNEKNVVLKHIQERIKELEKIAKKNDDRVIQKKNLAKEIKVWQGAFEALNSSSDEEATFDETY